MNTALIIAVSIGTLLCLTFYIFTIIVRPPLYELLFPVVMGLISLAKLATKGIG